MRLHRPHIPFEVRCHVAARQLGFFEQSVWNDIDRYGSWLSLLRRYLSQLSIVMGNPLADCILHLDHDPALQNRPFNKRTQKYTPDANDARYLIYRTKEDHRIKTLVRGDGAQYSDAAMARKRKRKERKAKRPKTRWPRRPLRSASRWPTRKAR